MSSGHIRQIEWVFVAVNLLVHLIFCDGGQAKSVCLYFDYVRVQFLTGEKYDELYLSLKYLNESIDFRFIQKRH